MGSLTGRNGLRFPVRTLVQAPRINDGSVRHTAAYDESEALRMAPPVRYLSSTQQSGPDRFTASLVNRGRLELLQFSVDLRQRRRRSLVRSPCRPAQELCSASPQRFGKRQGNVLTGTNVRKFRGDT